MENDLITADMVEVSEFPHLATKYQIQGVPKTVVNEDLHLEGARPEPRFLEEVLEFLKK